MLNRKILVLCLPAMLAACAAGTTSKPPTATVAALPDALKVAADESLLAVVAATGVQIYECRAKKDQPSAVEWAFVAPEAELLDEKGQRIGKHYAGPHWESTDGSKVAGTVKARADAPKEGAIPWLLLTTRSTGPAGAFAKVTSIQRVNTQGGMAPKDGCTAAAVGQQERVGYTADYLLFTRR